MEEVAWEVRSSRHEPGGVSDKRLETGALKTLRRARVLSRTPDSCLSGSSCSVVERGAPRSTQVSRIRAAAAACNSRSRAEAAEGSNTRDRGSGEVVDGELDAISMPN